MKWQLIFGPALGFVWRAACMPQLGNKASSSDAEPGLQHCPAQEYNNDLGNAPSWALRNVSRKLPKEDEVWMGFQITSKGYSPKWCYALVHVKGSAKSAEFSDVPCTGSNFSVSWGFSQENGAGIMTLVNRDSSRRCWFGWNHVNDSENLADVGPNATKGKEA